MCWSVSRSSFMQRLEFQPEFAEALRAKAPPIMVTGAGGWLGQAALEMLDAALGDDFGAHVTAFGARPRRMALRSGQSLTVHALDTMPTLERPGALVLHLAFLTREHAASMEAVTYIAENRKISGHVQEFLTRNGASGIFVPSSGAAYTGLTPQDNPYGALKREDEEIFARLAARLGFPAALPRVFNLAGPFINKQHSYALACIIADIGNHRPISLRAAHPVWRGYAHVGDMLNIAMGCLLRRHSPGIFDTGGEAIEIGDLAVRAARLLTRRELTIQRPEWRHGPADKYLGNAGMYDALAMQLGVAPHSLDAQIMDTAAYIQEQT
jgi:UDP-glucuronate decarboxylase